MTPVTDPELLAQLEQGAPAGLKPVTDAATLAALEAPDAPPRSVPAQIVRAVGRTVRAGVQGVAALPAMLANLPAAAYNSAADLYDSARSPGMGELITGKQRSFRFPDQAEALRNALTKLGLPQAETTEERVAEDVASGVAGAGGFVKLGEKLTKAATPLVQRIGEILSTAPKTQVVAGATGPGAASVVREEGGGPGAQLAAGVGGSLVPALPEAVRAAVRAGVRGGETGRLRVERNIETFEDAGAGTPTVGQATESRGMRAVESALSRTPGAAGRILTKAEDEAAGLGTKVDEMATSLAGRTGAAPAGRKIKSGLEHFVDEFKGASGKLYDELDKHIPQPTRVDVSNTRSALERLNADIPGAPNVSQLFKNARIKGIQGALQADTETTAGVHAALPAWQKQLLEQVPEVERTAMLNGLIDGKLPYEALKKLRTLVGNEISDSTIASDVPRSKWKALYAALSKDMGTAASAAGPKAEAAFVRANNHHRAGMQRLEDVLGPILKKGDPEDIFQAAIAGTKEGATTIQGVMKSLPVESRKAVAATMLRRLGKATPGKQDDLGEAFSPETFLTNWNRIDAQAKKSLFASLPTEMRGDLDKIAAVAANMREGSKVFANPSGTTQAAMSNMTAGAAFLSVLLGRVDVAAGIGATVAGSNVSARLMTNPAFVKFLAGSTRVPVEQVPAQLNQLFQQSLYLKRGEREDVRAFVKESREAIRAQQAQGRQ